MGTVVDDILANRQGKHGEFNENGTATWQIMRILMAQRSWPNLSDPQRHALYMGAHKMARIVAGDVNEADHWDDIAGYATLVADRIRSPVALYDQSTDIYGALAIAWNIPRDEAKKRAYAIGVSNKQARLEQELEEAAVKAAEEAIKT